ncbi:serine/threonine-protein kinase pim-2-like [Garra rufa]|uniref:serine/threonine-protein kinase pim-2-like n=1 Tax=Garra rufa TaxID=137080 RepID=UPI003CCE7F57
MGQRGTKVSPMTVDQVYEQHLSTPPKPSTNMAVQHPHPRDETPVGAGGGGEEEGGGVGEEGGEVGEPPDSESSSGQGEVEQQQDEGEKRTVAGAGRSSDDYIFSRYTVGDQLGKGGFGVVYEGRRLYDDRKVALKYVSKTKSTACIFIPDHPNPLPKEIALTILANRGPSVPEIIRLLDWTDHPDHFVLILECPSPCENLLQFIRRHGRSLSERTTRQIMWQAAHAANICCLRGVLHRDIKLENLLINRETFRVKLIDFGCGDILRSSSYKSYCGTAAYAPPEYRRRRKYYGKPATVWSLGVVMFALLCGRFPCDYDLFLLQNKRCSKPGLSKECCRLLRALLRENPSRRIDLGKILSHNWFKLCVLRAAVGDASIPPLAFASCGVSRPRVASCALA